MPPGTALVCGLSMDVAPVPPCSGSGASAEAALAPGNPVSSRKLAAAIRTLDLEPQSTHLAHMLGEISSAEDAAGRGMLTVVVVHKSGDGMPGAGFFELARSLGRDTGDKVAFWASELRKVHATWSSAAQG